MSNDQTLILLPMCNPDSASKLAALAKTLTDPALLVVVPYGVNAADVVAALPDGVKIEHTAALFWEKAVNAAWAEWAEYDFAGLVILREDAEVGAGWLGEMLACVQPGSVIAQGSAASDTEPMNGQDYGRIGLVGPVSDQTANPAQLVSLREQDAVMGLSSYAAARLDHFRGKTSSADWLDLSWLYLNWECAQMVTEMGSVDLVDSRCGEWAAQDIALRAEDRGWLPVVAEAVFASRTTYIGIGHQVVGDASSRANFYKKHAALRKSDRIVACTRVALRTLQDLRTWQANVGRLSQIADALAVVIVTNPLDIQADPEFLAAVKAGQVSTLNRTLLESCSGATIEKVKRSVATWVGKMFSGSVHVEVWTDPPDLYRERNHLYRNAERKLSADWILAVDSDEIIESRVTLDHLKRLAHHPNPMVRAYDLGFLHHWETPQLVRDDAPWGDGGNYSGGPHGVRFWRAGPTGQPRRLSASTRRVAPEVGPDGFRVAGIRVRRFSLMRAVDRAARLPAGASGDGMRFSTFNRRNGIGLHMLVYERENPEDVARWLDDLHGLCDEVVLVWTGDEFKPGAALSRVAKLHGAKIIHHPLADNIAEARNAGINELAKNERLGWALFFDPDEWLTDRVTEGAMLRRMADADKWGWLMQVANYRKDNGTPTISDSVRMSKLDGSKTMRMVGRVHEGFSESIHAIQARGDHPRLRYAPFVLQHRGMAASEQRMGEKLDHYERLLRLDLADNQHNPGAWVSLGWHYANDGHQDLAVECYENAIACAGQSYLPFKEMAYVHLRLARDLVEKCHDRLTEAHQFHPVSSKLREFLTAYAPPHPIIDRGARPPAALLPDFAPPEVTG